MTVVDSPRTHSPLRLDSATVTFPGIDAQWPATLRATVAGRPSVQGWLDEVLTGVHVWMESEPAQATGWFTTNHLHPACPPEQAVAAPYLLAGTVLASLASLNAAEHDGLATLLDDPRTVTTGHSVGLITAAAAGGDLEAAISAVTLALVLGVEATAAARTMGAAVTSPTPEHSPMAALRGPFTETVRSALTAGVEIAVINGIDRHVLSGRPGDLATFHASLVATQRSQAADSKQGQRIGAVTPIQWEYLHAPVPFHHSGLAQAAARVARWGLRLRPSLTTIDPATGRPLSADDAVHDLALSVLARPHDWAATLRDLTPTTVLAVGNHPAVHALTETAVQGTGTSVLHTESRLGREVLAGRAPLPTPSNYQRFAPTRDGGRLVTKHTQLTGRSPFVVAGMTPTTVDAAIVAAAANAGHVAELAGGGQVTEGIFQTRIAELHERLLPGREVVFNALHLDPYLWDLHLGSSRLIQKARMTGAPICGVTISAGMPDADDAVALLEELNDLGIWLNALKPGTVAGVKAALEIAGRITHPLWLHVEGGQAGGHHSWDDLEELLLRTYPLIREHDNVVLAVGGGIGTPERAAQFLTGSWSTRHGQVAMPVDAILLGTATMACAESTASDSVKRALAATTGPQQGWVRRAHFEAGMTSGLSGLNADIHFLDNSASRAAALLDEVAGDDVAVQARSHDIIAALAKTAKPYFGDLTAMTYEELLTRFVELTAVGSGTAYQQGVWLDRTHRDRFLDLVHRAEARLHPIDDGPIVPVIADVDDPAESLQSLRASYPLQTRVHPADVDFFLAVCRRPGKPVPFVPILDADVRKWYQSDALWQSHDEHYDADQVLVIPGPAAVAGITEPNEPVADLVERFTAACLPMVPAATAEPTLTTVLRAPVVRWAGQTRPNPLHRIGRWHVTHEATWTDGRETATLRPVGDEIQLRLTWPALTEDDGQLDLGFVVRDGLVHVTGLDGATIPTAVDNPDADSAHATLLESDAVLPDAAMRGLWPSVFSVLRDAAPHALLDLVHARHRLTRAQTPVPAAVTGRNGAPGGYHLTAVAGDGHWTATDTFFIRQPHSDLAPVSTPANDWIDTPHLRLASLTRTAPESLDSFAAVTGDLNPIHRSDALGRLVGLPGRIVHGMWTSALGQAAAIRFACDGDPQRLVEWDIQFTAAVMPGALVEATVTRTGVVSGTTRGEVVIESDGHVVAIGTATIAAARTAYVFPGQGIQHVGMGMDGYERSAAARAVWDEADAHCRQALGFSVLEVVRDNPSTLIAGVPGNPDAEHIYRHPAGVLFLTQFTQVAMATLASAQVAEMRERGVFNEHAVTAGHSVGEYNALAAVTGTLPLADLVELVFARGTAMHHLVPRDADGSSQYRLGVVRPHLAGLDHEQTETLVKQVAADTGQLCQIVNHNLRGKQYAVAGTVAALDELSSRLGSGSAGKPPFLLVPGIDVPFHSAALTAGVDEFRQHLLQRLPESIDPRGLVGRYVPNLYPVPFAITAEYVQAVIDVCGSPVLQALLATWDTQTPEQITSTLLVELLAWQFAMPVRWIETTDVLCGELEVQRIVEVGVGAAPTLTNLTKGALALGSHRGTRLAVLNIETDADEVFEVTATPQPVAEEAPAPDHDQAPIPIPTRAEVVDRPVDHAQALRAVIALRASVRTDQIDGTIDDLVDGASSRRNQLLMDVGKEFAISGMDGAHEAALDDVIASIAAKASGYRFPGPVLGVWLDADVSATLGRQGISVAQVRSRVTDHWGLGQGWTDRVVMHLGLDTRAGTSKRGGALATLTGEGSALIDAAVLAAGSACGIDLTPASSSTSTAVDAAAVSALGDKFEDILTEAAMSILSGLGRSQDRAAVVPDSQTDRLHTLDTEHGPGHALAVAGVFTAGRCMELASGSAWARADIDHLVQGAAAGRADEALVDQIAVHRDSDPRILATLRWYQQRAALFGDRASAVRTVVSEALTRQPRGVTVDLGAAHRVVDPDVLAAVDRLAAAPGQFADEVAVVTGASPGSIAASTVAHLLRGGATVVAVTSSVAPERLAFYRDLERRYAAPGAVLHVARANLASFSDIDDLLEWLTTPTQRVTGPISEVVKPALWPTLVLPFAAGLTGGSLADTGPDNEVTLRLLTLGVQRLIGRLGEQILAAGRTPATVVLPLSPNHGTFGGDGSYGDAKAALETILNRWHSEQKAWAAGTRIVGAEIGWVRGTGLMAANDAVAAHVEEHLGVMTFSAEQMGALIAAVATFDITSPRRVDLTGGLSQVIGLAEVLRSAPSPSQPPPQTESTIDALPHPAWPAPAQDFDVTPERGADDMIVIAGIAEIGPWGASSSRWQAEIGDLDAAAVTELAWRMGLIEWDPQAAQWTDLDGEHLTESEIRQTFGEVVADNVGVRALSATADVAATGTTTFTEVYLDKPVTIGDITYPAGTAVRVPTTRPLQRQVGGQFPRGIDPTRHGLTQGLAQSMDPLAAWNLVVSAEALTGCGVSAEELADAVHPSLIGNVQGTGMGGMNSLHALYVDPLLGTSHANDLLQEALGNVVSAHANQSVLGGYGPMVHPVAACATAAVSLEEAVDKIRLGKAEVVLAGGYDDLSSEGINGFADMAATADNSQLLEDGIPARAHSRPGDRRRAGFVEAQGGGSFLVVRGSVALRLGLPVRAVVAYAASFGDGVQTSIPAPGLGALGAARGGRASALATGLRAHGLDVDDIAVVSKHDTSTRANDPNEALIHATINRALGRSDGNPLRVISQKSVTGHAKGGAAAWQIAGLCDVFATGIVPGNKNLVSVDPEVTPPPLVVDNLPLHRADPVRAAVLTSLGFGHVNAVVALAHPAVFTAAVPDTERADYLRRSAQRRLDGAWRLLAAQYGGPAVFARRTERPHQDDEIALLIGDNA